MRMELASGWHLLRVEISGRHEWIICDPEGDRLGITDKHKVEFDKAMLAEVRTRENKIMDQYDAHVIAFHSYQRIWMEREYRRAGERLS
jgi:hypothetical protein